MAASVEKLVIDENYRCGYCFQPRDDLNDPRVLPCSHVFCYECISSDYRSGCNLHCPICRFQHADLTIRDLPSYYNELPETCDVCEEIADLCCNQCSINLCKLHAKEHDDSFALSSKFNKHQQAVELNAKGKAFLKEDKHFCALHSEKETRRACARCYKSLCADCALDGKCTGEKSHIAEKVEILCEKLKKELNAIMDDLHALLTSLSNKEKEANIILSAKEQAVEEMKALVDKVTLEQINEIQDNAKKIKSFIDETFRSCTQNVKKYCDVILANKESAEDVIKNIHGLVNTSSEFDIIGNYKRNILAAESIYESIPSELSLPFVAIRQIEKQREAEVEISIIQEKVMMQNYYTGTRIKNSSVPRTLDYVHASGTETSKKPVYAVHWLPKNYLAAGSEGYIGIKDGKLQESKIVKVMVNGSVGSICKHGEDFLVLIHNTCAAFNGCRIDRYTNDFKYLSTDIFGPVGTYAPHMALVKNQVLLTDLGNKCFKVYTIEKEHVMDISFESDLNSVAGILGLEDNSFLASDNVGGRVAKFRLEANSKPLWVCIGLYKPTGIATDTSGLIYVISGGIRTVYLLTPSGKLVTQFLPDSNSISSYQSIAISGKNIAIGTSSNVHCLKII